MTEIRSATQRQRDKIRSGKIIDRLVKHVNGELDMTPTQVRAASILLNKVLPDMKAVEIDVHAQIDTISHNRLTDEQLMAIAAQGFSPNVIEGKVATTPKKLKAL